MRPLPSFIWALIFALLEVFVLSGLPILGVTVPATLLFFALARRSIHLDFGCIGAAVGAFLGDVWLADKGEYLAAMLIGLLLVRFVGGYIPFGIGTQSLFVGAVVTANAIASLLMQGVLGSFMLSYIASLLVVTLGLSVLIQKVTVRASRII